VSVQRASKVGPLHVVHFQVSVVRGGDEKLRVWRETEGADGHGVALEGVDEFAGRDVEDVNEAFDGTGCDIFAIRTVGEGQDEFSCWSYKRIGMKSRSYLGTQ
jgi:hypothetical protein